MKGLPSSQNEEIDLANLKIVLRFTDKDFSRYSLFIPLFKFCKTFLKLEDKFSRHLKLNYKSKFYELHRVANSIVCLISCGVDRFVRMDDEFRVERGLAKSLGFPRGFFSSDTVYRFFSSFTGWNIKQLEKINLEILAEHKSDWYPKTASVFIDLDMNTKSVEGKQIEKAALGYNRKSPGRLSLSWTVAHIAKVALFSELSSGNTSGKTILKKQIEHVEKLMKKLDIGLENDKQKQRFVFRVDGGYFSFDNLLFLNERKFITRVPVNLSILKPIFSPSNFKKLKWRKYSAWSSFVDLGNIEAAVLGEEPEEKMNLRLVLVKVKRKKKTLLYPLFTNLFNWKTKAIVKGYRGRQIVENCFRDTNQAFYANKLPSSKFHGNQAFLWFIIFAYNLFFFFQKNQFFKKTFHS